MTAPTCAAPLLGADRIAVRPAPNCSPGQPHQRALQRKLAAYGFSTGSRTAFPHSVQEPS